MAVTISATELKNRLGRYLEVAIREPVFVNKSGRESIIIMSRQRYEELQTLEDELWALRARLAEQEGFIGAEETLKALKDALANQDSDHAQAGHFEKLP